MKHSNHIALHTGKQEACSVEVGNLISVLEKSITEPKPNDYSFPEQLVLGKTNSQTGQII